MRFTARRAALPVLAAMASAGLLAGCAQAPSTSSTSPSTSSTSTSTATQTTASNFLPCMISDSGGFDDHSFNELGYDGLIQAAKDLGVSQKNAESKTDADYANNISAMLNQNCSLIITVGYLLADATKAAAQKDPKTDFAIIDDNSIDLPNVQPIVFDTAEAAFLGGYAAASYSKTGIVGTYGGMQIPTVTIYMDGFYDGVQYYNQQKGKSVQVVGWNEKTQKGSFTGGFDNNTAALTTAQGVLNQNADVVMPVGGPIYQAAASAIKSSSKAIALIGVDADVYNTDSSVRSILLTSVEKGIQQATEAVIKDTAAGKFAKTPYIGTLKNDGVGLAPFHDFASKVDSGLQGELDTIKQGIISGSIKVATPSAPKS